MEAILKKVGNDACKPKGLSKDVGLKGKKYKLSPDQSKAILELRLGRLTGLEQDNLSKEFTEIVEKIIGLQKTIERHIQCLHATAYFLIMRGQDVEKHL